MIQRTSDALQVAEQLKDEFEHIRSSTNPKLAVKDFEDFRPDVLVLAFNTLEKAQRYYRGVYRMGRAPLQHDHRTIILCNKDEVRTVFELCKKEYSLVRGHYYHPAMMGSWSIKSVLPTIAPHLDYSKLEGVQDGGGAQDAFLEANHPETSPVRRQQLTVQMLRYCERDTQAMIEVAQFLSK